jgi:hypothetical protein
MPDWLVSRAAIITLAVLGGIFAVLASLLRSGGAQGSSRGRRLTVIAYIFMVASMILFVIAGFSRGRS